MRMQTQRLYPACRSSSSPASSAVLLLPPLQLLQLLLLLPASLSSSPAALASFPHYEPLKSPLPVLEMAA
jgi:hypothetical protein